MLLIADKMDAGPAHMAAIGYIASYKPKNPKPVPKLLEDEECWDKLVADVAAYIDSFKNKRTEATRTVKPFVISIIDTLGYGVEKETKVCYLFFHLFILYLLVLTMPSLNKRAANASKDSDHAPALSTRESLELDALQCIEKAHYCQEHKKPCFVQVNGSHYQYTASDLAKWAFMIVSHTLFFRLKFSNGCNCVID